MQNEISGAKGKFLQVVCTNNENKEGRNQVEGEEHPGRPSISTDES